MVEETNHADQLLCEHHWTPRPTGKRNAQGEPIQEMRCQLCDLPYASYVRGTVRGALSRMGAWDEDEGSSRA